MNRSYRAKIVKMLLDGTVSSVVEIKVRENALGSKRKSLEKDAWTFRYSDISLSLDLLDIEFFRTYDYYLNAYFLWIERTDDGAAYETEFFGYLPPKSIKTLKPSLRTSINALSCEKLFDNSPNIISRGVYRGAIGQFAVQILTAETGDQFEGPIQDVALFSFEDGQNFEFFGMKAIAKLLLPFDAESLPYKRIGSTLQFSMSQEQGGSINIQSTIFETPEHVENVNGEVDDWYAPIDLYTIGNTVYPLNGHAYDHGYTSEIRNLIPKDPNDFDPGSDNPPKILFIRDEVLSRGVKNQYDLSGTQGIADAFVRRPEPNPFNICDQWRFGILKAEYGRFLDANAEPFEGVRMELQVDDRTSGVNALVTEFLSAQWTFCIAPPSAPDPPIEVIILSNEMYGVGENDAAAFDGEELLQALCDLVPFFKHLTPTVVWHGEARTVARSMNLSPSPSAALLEMQKAMDVLISFDFGPPGVNLIPQVLVNVYTRQWLRDQDKVEIPIPIQWDEEPAGKLPVVVVEGPGPTNIYNAASKTVGWYSEDTAGVPNATPYASEVPSGTGHVQLTIEKIELHTFSFFDGDVKDYYYNDHVLREVAKGVYEFYGRFYRTVTATAYDPQLIIPDLVGRIITEPSQNKDGIVMEQETNYQTRQVSITLLMDTLDTI